MNAIAKLSTMVNRLAQQGLITVRVDKDALIKKGVIRY